MQAIPMSLPHAHLVYSGALSFPSNALHLKTATHSLLFLLLVSSFPECKINKMDQVSSFQTLSQCIDYSALC